MSDVVGKVAGAIEDAEFGYSMNLTSLVDGVSTYTLTYSDGSPPLEFPGTDEAYAHIASKRAAARARSAIAAMPLELLIREAYVRGVEWNEENPLDREYRFKAAADYADKVLSAALKGEVE